MVSLKEIWTRKEETKTPTVNKTTNPISTIPSPQKTSGLAQIWNSSPESNITSVTNIPVDTRSTFRKISDTGEGLATSFTTGLGSTTGRILDQIFHLGTKYLETKDDLKNIKRRIGQKALGKVGIDIPDRSEKEAEKIKKLEEYRLKFKENLLGGTDIAREENPIAGTFAGQTAEIIGGVVPQVALAIAKVPQIALALSESVMNTEDSYDKNIKSGMSSKEAMKRALPQLGADLLGTYLTNKFGTLGKFSGKGKKAFKSVIMEGLKDSSLEVVQEVWQTGLQNLATDKPFTEGMGETAKLTIIPALLFGAAGNIGSIQAQKETKEKISQAMILMNQKIQNGEELTEQEKALQAITGGIDPFIVSTANLPVGPTFQEAIEIAKERVPIETTLENEVSEDKGVIRGVSKIAKSIQTKSVEAGLTKGFSNLAGYDKITIKDQSERAVAAIESDIQEVRAILRGEKELPTGLKGTALIKAVEDYIIKNPNTDIAYELANSPLITGTSEAAQELRLAAERDPDSATSKIQEIRKTREEKAGKLKTARAKKIAKKLVEATKEVNLSKEDLQWDNFLNSITC